MKKTLEMISAGEALRLVLEASKILESEEVSAEAACGRVLAKPLSAREDLPAFDNSSMDGYALRSRDVSGACADSPKVLILDGGARAGGPPASEVGPGKAVRVLTGAPVPAGADCVVMQEKTATAGDGRLLILEEPESGQFVRRRGEDVASGAPLLEAGTLLRPVELGLLAAQGLGVVRVVRRPRVALVATGDELARPAPGAALRDSSGPALAAACTGWGAEFFRHPPVGDDRAAIAAAVRLAAAKADVVLLTGGVSVGDYDFTRAALEDLGAEIVFAGVSIRPGKPLLFARLAETLVFGLPGNPVSSLVCAEEFVLPALRGLRGLGPEGPSLEGEVSGSFSLRDERRHYLFCRAHWEGGRWRLELLASQGSARLTAASRADALAIAEGGPRTVKAGETLRFRRLT